MFWFLWLRGKTRTLWKWVWVLKVPASLGNIWQWVLLHGRTTLEGNTLVLAPISGSSTQALSGMGAIVWDGDRLRTENKGRVKETNDTLQTFSPIVLSWEPGLRAGISSASSKGSQEHCCLPLLCWWQQAFFTCGHSDQCLPPSSQYFLFSPHVLRLCVS